MENLEKEPLVNDENEVVNSSNQENNNQATSQETITSDDDKVNFEEELAKEKDKFLRLFAEFENYKKRTTKERIELFKTANQEVLQALLPVVDDFDRALVEIQKSSDENLNKGITLIYDKFKSTLKSKGLEEVELQPGDIFNADFAEAITQIPAQSDDLKGKIVDVIEKGYKLGDKIIRFPKVVIGN